MARNSNIELPQRPHSSSESCAGLWCMPPPQRRSYVVYLDGGPYSQRAVHYAGAFARKSAAPSRIVLVAPAYNADNLAVDAAEYLQTAAREVEDRIESQITTVRIDSRNVAQSLQATAADAALVVMSQQRAGWLERSWYGTVASQLMTQLKCPLLLIPRDNEPFSRVANPTLTSIAVPLDGSSFSERAVSAVATLGLARGAQCILTHIQDMDQLIGQPLDNARGYLRDVASRAAHSFSLVRTDFAMGFQRIAPAFLSIAHEQGADLIALATRARSGLARFMKPSIAAQILRHAEVPVLLCGPGTTPKPLPG